MEAIGGRVEIESEADKGTSFSAYFKNENVIKKSNNNLTGANVYLLLEFFYAV